MNVSQKYLNESSNSINIGNNQAVAKSSSFSHSTGHFYSVLFLQCSVVVSQTPRRRAFQVAAFHTTSWKFIDSTQQTQPKMMVRKKGFCCAPSFVIQADYSSYIAVCSVNVYLVNSIINRGPNKDI